MDAKTTTEQQAFFTDGYPPLRLRRWSENTSRLYGCTLIATRADR
jgi:hypothetical protein